jgi:hypothetical protein
MNMTMYRTILEIGARLMAPNWIFNPTAKDAVPGNRSRACCPRQRPLTKLDFYQVSENQVGRARNREIWTNELLKTRIAQRDQWLEGVQMPRLVGERR